jgi:hypothetical protein
MQNVTTPGIYLSINTSILIYIYLINAYIIYLSIYLHIHLCIYLSIYVDTRGIAFSIFNLTDDIGKGIYLSIYI